MARPSNECLRAKRHDWTNALLVKNRKNGVHSMPNQLKREWGKVPFLVDTERVLT
jgi:hypothetical protein